MSTKLEDLGKSMELAGQIEMIKSVLFTMDVEHLKAAIKAFRDQVSWQDSAAVLNPSYDSTKSKLLYLQSKTLQALLEFWDGLQQCQQLKDTIAINDANRKEIESLFF